MKKMTTRTVSSKKNTTGWYMHTHTYRGKKKGRCEPQPRQRTSLQAQQQRSTNTAAEARMTDTAAGALREWQYSSSSSRSSACSEESGRHSSSRRTHAWCTHLQGMRVGWLHHAVTLPLAAVGGVHAVGARVVEAWSGVLDRGHAVTLDVVGAVGAVVLLGLVGAGVHSVLLGGHMGLLKRYMHTHTHMQVTEIWEVWARAKTAQTQQQKRE